MMKFINILTESKQDYLNDIVEKMSISEVEYIESLYSKFDAIEYIDDEDNECMFAILDDNILSSVLSLYKKYGVNFKVIDLSLDIFYDNHFDVLFENNMGQDMSHQILKLILKFKEDFITKDIILDKILSKGISSLTEFDKEILDN
jgi:hypothetical protein